tara:strand:+ start:1836 stop:2771 length:936 start_codon:yes stop_codon:yes gene_type:complete
MSKANKLTVNLYRDGSLESSHEINVYTNNKQYKDYFFPRSSVKPMQVIPLLLEASKQNIEFTSEEIALFAASHSGQVKHINLLKKTALKYQVNLEEIICGPQRPFHDETADNLLISGNKYSKLHNNCSGKHLSMLIFSKLLSVDSNNYYELIHKTQEITKQYFIEIFENEDIGFGIDGCGLPAINLNVTNFLNSIDFMQNSRSAESWSKVFDAYIAHPEIIGGENRTDTNIIINSKRRLLAKSGAEGVLFVTDNSDSYIFNCSDGSKRGVDLATSHFLYSNGWIDIKPYEYLDDIYTSNRQNTRAVEIEVV